MTRFIKGSLAITMLAAATAKCGEYPHTNPIEPSANVSLVIVGPTVLTQRSSAVYTVETNPAMPGVLPDWSSRQPAVLEFLARANDGSGVFRVVAGGTAQISVALGPHVQTRTVVVQIP